MDMTLMQLRRLLRTAGDAIPVRNTRITTSELLASCGDSTLYALCTYLVPCVYYLTTRSSLVPIGGKALGAFLTLFASRRLLASFRQLIVAHEADATVVADPAFMAKAPPKVPGMPAKNSAP